MSSAAAVSFPAASTAIVRMDRLMWVLQRWSSSAAETGPPTNFVLNLLMARLVSTRRQQHHKPEHIKTTHAQTARNNHINFHSIPQLQDCTAEFTVMLTHMCQGVFYSFMMHENIEIS